MPSQGGRAVSRIGARLFRYRGTTAGSEWRQFMVNNALLPVQLDENAGQEALENDLLRERDRLASENAALKEDHKQLLAAAKVYQATARKLIRKLGVRLSDVASVE